MTRGAWPAVGAVCATLAVLVGVVGYFRRWYLPDPERGFVRTQAMLCNNGNTASEVSEMVFSHVDKAAMPETDRLALAGDAQRGPNSALCRSMGKITISNDPIHGIKVIEFSDGRAEYHETPEGWRMIHFVIKPSS